MLTGGGFRDPNRTLAFASQLHHCGNDAAHPPHESERDQPRNTPRTEALVKGLSFYHVTEVAKTRPSLIFGTHLAPEDWVECVKGEY